MVCLSNVTVKCIGEPILLEQYVVLKNYQKQYHNDISLTKGYTVGVIEKHESGKYTMFFPESVVNIISDEIPKRALSMFRSRPWV